MSYRGENLNIEVTPLQLEVLATAIKCPMVQDLLEENNLSDQLLALDELDSKLDEIVSMVNGAGYGYKYKGES
jgi:hypothetical protein